MELNKSKFLIQLIKWFNSPGSLYFIMDYIPGGNLYTNLKSVRSFSEDQTKFIIAQIVLALEDLHSKNIIHRDLKAENILLRENGYVVLADYGLSKIFEEDNPTRTKWGTKQYMAPEVYKGETQKKTVDWWAVGILAYEMLAGRTPFKDNEYKILKSMLRIIL
jgi:serine/threonine protein kinase